MSADVARCPACKQPKGGYFSPKDGRFVSTTPRVPTGKLDRHGNPIFGIRPVCKLLHRLRHTEGGCWEWVGPVNNKGYGTCRLRGERYAHRASYVLHFGPIPDGLVICHECDNPRCCNPDHMWLGTLADNNRDMFAKGRGNNQFDYRGAT